ncbi:MAG: Phospho-N-acetylmuramoyl-pentapeptide-transferase [Verrucomicrobia subdivision 3 bacterium]|nr:Phospho-N-acetylmuramoyl-pentapeptide-transferase [Limisphaerales bacterium]MCS1412383.1 Phospho-N-acetylmuramoyl-pentapeptide-transferase [Limisphaerales bacterium]
MLYYLHQYVLESVAGSSWEGPLSGLRVFRYITVRSIGAAFTALVLSWLLAPYVITWLKALKFRQNYVDKAEATGDMIRVTDKKGTPTMGGVLIVLALDLSVLLWAQWSSFVLLTLLSLVVLSALGFYDDYLKVIKQDNEGAKSNVKLWVQVILSLAVVGYLWMVPDTRSLIADVMVPFIKYPILENVVLAGTGITVLAIVGSSNAVNLTDGLDGLAIGCTIIVTIVFILMTYVAGNIKFATYLQIPYVRGAGELTVFCAAMLGASVGFLWYNCHPAQVFMGDTGSLALGGALGIMAVLIHQPFILVIAGGVFVAEAVSVILQVGWYKYHMKCFGVDRRLFLRAPLHHHFEKMGWQESKVVTRFYILSGLCAGLALLTLKIR